MLKLYKLINKTLHYWETWDTDDGTGIMHWGIVGEEGDSKEVKSGLFSNYKKVILKEVDKRVSDGYAEIDDEDHASLEIEYIIDGFGTEEELDKRHRLEEKLDEILGWTGLGNCNGGSIGGGTMEAGCMVVDFDIAKGVVEANLNGTEFEDYARIFRLDED
jgi:hypothetical protein